MASLDGGAACAFLQPHHFNPTIGVCPSGLSRPFEAADNYLTLGAMQTLRQSDEAHLWREQYLRQSFNLVSTVLYLTFMIVIVVGVGLVDLSDTVLVTILTTTVAHVVGILAIAFHWLYPYGSKTKED